LVRSIPASVSAQTTQTLTLQGTGFSAFTKCQIPDSLLSIPTIYVSPYLIQCTVTSQNLVGLKMLSLSVQAHSMFNSNILKITVNSAPYVSALYPTFLGEETRFLHVSVQHPVNATFDYCLANRTIVVPILKENATTTCPATGTICTSEFFCKFYLRPGFYVIEMMNSDGDYTRTIAGQNTLQVIPRPAITNIRVPALPLHPQAVVEVIGFNLS
jgi:hypothetical protein